MSWLLEDLKSDFWRRAARLMYTVAIIGIPLVLLVGRAGVIALTAMIVIPIGMGMIQRPGDVVDKPFSFCLPGFRESLRRRYFTAAMVMGAALSLSVLVTHLWLDRWYPSVNEATLAGMCAKTFGTFLTGMVIAFTIGTLRFVLSALVWNIILLLSIPLLLAAVVVFSALVEYPLLSIPLCSAAGVFVWIRLADMARVKRVHRDIIQSVMEMQTWTSKTQTTSSWVESLFRGQMGRSGYFGTGRYIWGSLYGTFARVLSGWWWIGVSIVGGALVVGYMGDDLKTMAFFALSAPVAFTTRRPTTFGGTLVPAGRRERFYAAIATDLAISLVLFIAMAAVMALSWVLWPLMPGLLGGSAGGFVYTPIRPGSIYMSLLLLPWLFAMQLLRGRAPILNGAIFLLIVAVLVLVVFFSTGEELMTGLDWMGGGLLISLTACGVVFFVLVLRHACAKWDIESESYEE